MEKSISQEAKEITLDIILEIIVEFILAIIKG